MKKRNKPRSTEELRRVQEQVLEILKQSINSGLKASEVYKRGLYSFSVDDVLKLLLGRMDIHIPRLAEVVAEYNRYAATRPSGKTPKIGAEKLADIQQARLSGKSDKEIGSEFNITPGYAQFLLSGKSQMPGAIKIDRPVKKGNNHGHTTIPGKKHCKKCGITKTFKEFARLKSSKDGLAFYCKACAYEAAREYNKKRRASLQINDPSLKKCANCGNEKPVEGFSRYTNGRIRTTCKDCARSQAGRRTKNIIATATSFEEAGQIINRAIKEYVANLGYSLNKLPPHFPYSARAVYDIGRGVWGRETLKSLPFDVDFKIELRFTIPGTPEMPYLSSKAELQVLRMWMDGNPEEDICASTGISTEQMAEFRAAFLKNGFRRKTSKKNTSAGK